MNNYLVSCIRYYHTATVVIVQANDPAEAQVKAIRRYEEIYYNNPQDVHVENLDLLLASEQEIIPVVSYEL
jgi:hypothetical protein